ncbi:MAG: tRNA (adenosine(37)-N6)-threonylcarbamoyltransferase complex dimerization subunit type 1 TsaB [Myxococcota bacterium]|nr:tRNA (adenosine(37)-N6)-threonylcarbamoyltransferase complex dimerization subunit type 1 TsaB [Myxococcota bacterium]
MTTTSPTLRTPSRVLALCSASRIASAALLEGDKIIVEHTAPTSRQQAESLLPLVDRVLVDSETSIESLAGIGVSLGPGSFTSLRIGVATVKGLVFGLDTPVVGVSTLQALALASGAGNEPVVAALDAQRAEVYAAAFDTSQPSVPALEAVLPQLVYTADELANQLQGPLRLVGEGAAIVGDRLRERLGSKAIQLEPEPAEASAAQIGRLAAMRLAAGEGGSAADLAPHYVRRAEAEVTRTRERFEA